MAGYYGKRPLWKWILIYVIIGAVIYELVYYFFFANKSGINYGNATSPVIQQAPGAAPANVSPLGY